MKEIHSQEAPKPAGHYAQAVEHMGLVFVSGQLPVHPRTGVKEIGPIEAQTRQALANVEAILSAAGCGKRDVIKTTVYVSDITLWDRVNTVYAEFFGDHRPARAVVPTRELHFGYQVEIEAIAAVPGRM
ncbi:MAG: RidA family protein [Spirochaetota bacterium]|nr:RidA family protein [Spirochaetota bacterium]